MRLLIAHEIEFAYPKPIRSAVLSLKLQPGGSDAQRIVDWTIAPNEGAKLSEPFTNGYGDKIHTLTFAGPAESWSVSARGTVDTRDLAGVLKGWRERARPGVFLRETDRTEPDDALRALGAEARAAASSDLDLAHRLMAAVRGRLIHEEGEPGAAKTAAEALAAGQGDAEDFAHVMISAARTQGLPARFILGYAAAPEGAEEAEASALNVWAEIYVEGIGWIGFDAANDLSPSDGYVRLGAGFDAEDAAPIRISVRGAEDDEGEIRERIRVTRAPAGGQSQSQGGQSQSQSQGGQSQRQG